MASKKMKGARLGAKVGTRVAPKAGKAAWKLGKAEGRLVRRAIRPQEPKGLRFLKYGFFALAGLAIGSFIAHRKHASDTSSFTDTTGQHAPEAGSPAGQR